MAKQIDPRLYQIAVLASLLAYGVIWLDFGVSWGTDCRRSRHVSGDTVCLHS